MDIDFIVAFKNSAPERERNLRFMLYYYHKYRPDFNFIVVEQDTITDLRDIQYVKHIKIQIQTDFNKSKLYNLGYRVSTSKYLIFCDVDIILEKDRLLKIEQMLDEKKLVFPFNTPLVDLNEYETISFMNVERLEKYRFKNNFGHGGAIHFISRESYLEIAGYDEQFVGWGGEDGAFVSKAERLIGITWLEGSVYHMWHPSAKRPFKKYKSKLMNIKNMSINELKRYVIRNKYKLL